LLPLIIDDTWTDEVRVTLPELPATRKQRFAAEYTLPAYDAELLTARKDIADYFEAAVKVHANPKALSNWIVGDLFRVLKERKLDDQLYISQWPVVAAHLAQLVQMIDHGKITGKIAKTVFEAMLDFVGKARGPNSAVRAAVYEFNQGAVLQAFAKAPRFGCRCPNYLRRTSDS